MHVNTVVQMGELRYRNIKKLAWGSLWELTLFCERPTHHPFPCQILSFYSSPSLQEVVGPQKALLDSMCLYLPTAMIIYYTRACIPRGAAVLSQSQRLPLLAGRGCFAGDLAGCSWRQLHQEESSAKSTVAVCWGADLHKESVPSPQVPCRSWACLCWAAHSVLFFK